jgi:hypothetical protein
VTSRPEKRKAPRIQPYVAPCRVAHGSRRIPGYLTDLSRLGARVACDEAPPALGEAVVLEVRFSRRAVHSPLPAVVKWSRPPGLPDEVFVVGLTFSGVSADDQRVLEGVLDEFRRRAALFGLADLPRGGDPGDRRREQWHEGPETGATGWLGLADDELLYRIEALPLDHSHDEELLAVIRSERHFFIRQEAAKKIRDYDRLRDHAGDRHIGQILVRALTRGSDVAYLERLLAGSRHLEVRNAAEAQLRKLGWMPNAEEE